MNLSRIDQLGRVVTGKTPSSESPEEFGSEYPFITPSDIPRTQKFVTTERSFSEKGLAKHKRARLPTKSVCVVCIGATIGKVCTTSSPSFANQQINSIVPDTSRHSPEFVYYLATTLRDALISFAGGSATPILNKSDFSSIKILVPELSHQQKIAAILSAYDDLIANNQRRITLLERMAEDIYREWFVRLRFPGHEQVKLEKGVPKGWRFAELGSVCTQIKRGIAPNYSETSAALVINQRCIRDGSVDLVEARGHDTKVPTEKFVRHGDVLINSTGVGTLGRVAVFDHEATSATCDTHVTICRAKPEAASAYFLGHCLMSLQGHFESMAVGSTGQSELGREAISRTAILLPPLGTQMTFAGAVAPLWRAKRLLQRQNKALATTRDALLPRLISGKLAVDALDIRFPPGMQLADKINL